jgi:hypothetical protein
MSSQAFADLTPAEIDVLRGCLARIRDSVGRAEAAQKESA